MIIYEFITITDRTAFLKRVNEVCKEQNKIIYINVNSRKIEIDYLEEADLKPIIDAVYLEAYDGKLF